MKERKSSAMIAAFVGLFLTLWAPKSPAIEAVRPTIAVYIVENQPLTSERPSFAEAVTTAELKRLGYKVLPSLKVTGLDLMVPKDVGPVWNADRRMTFRKTIEADLLWVSTIEYKPDTNTTGQAITGKVSIATRVFVVATGESLWFGQVKDLAIGGLLTPETARVTLAEALPTIVGTFDRDPKVRAFVPPLPGKGLPIGPTIGPPLIGRTPVLLPGPPGMPPRPSAVSPESSRAPYTGVIIDAEHLPVLPSYRSGIYSEAGKPLLSPTNWAESAATARQQAGANPLRIRAFSTDGNRIVLRESDCRRLQQERVPLDPRRVTVIVQPPRRR